MPLCFASSIPVVQQVKGGVNDAIAIWGWLEEGCAYQEHDVDMPQFLSRSSHRHESLLCLTCACRAASEAGRERCVGRVRADGDAALS